MAGFFESLLDPSDFPARWDCGSWTQLHGWTHILGDIGIWGAYTSIPVVLAYYVVRRRDIPFIPIFWLFAAFIFFCGITHAMEAAIFWWPAYRISAVLKISTAAVSWATVLALWHYTPSVLSLPGLAKVNAELEKARAELEDRVRERTAELEKANAELQKEIAEHRLTEQALRQSEEELRAAQRDLEGRVMQRTAELATANDSLVRLAAIVESSDDAIVGKNSEGIITDWNKGAERLYGYRAEEVLGSHHSILHFPDTGTTVDEILQTIKRGERHRLVETVRRRKDGQAVHVSLNVSPVKAGDGRLIGFSSIARDISEQLRNRRRVEAYAARLEASNQDLQRFAYIASHDLKTPLRSVAIYVQLLDKRFGDRIETDGKRLVAGAVRNVEQMTELIDDLLEFSRLQRAERKYEPVPLESLLGRAEEHLQLVIAETDAVVTNGDLPMVQVDPTMFTMLFQNLVGNAIKFRGEETPRVHISSERLEDKWVIAVTDNGIGIEPKYFDRIFEIFKRLHSNEKYPGTGIGLALCKKVVERHGGEIWVDSELGRGTTVRLTIPDQLPDEE